MEADGERETNSLRNKLQQHIFILENHQKIKRFNTSPKICRKKAEKQIWSDGISVQVLWLIAFQRIECHFSIINFLIKQLVGRRNGTRTFDFDFVLHFSNAKNK